MISPVLRWLLVPGIFLAWLTTATGSLHGAEAIAEGSLPIRRVVLYTSGVGFFERSGKVKDDATIELRFGARDINDLLKSLVLEDLDGGQVTTVSYNARSPISQSLKNFSIDLTASPSLADLLQQVRGAAVRVTAPEPVTGKILGIEQHKQVTDRGVVITHDVLNLLTTDGLRAIPLMQATEVQLLDAKLNAELNEALALLAQTRSTDKKAVTLRCTGKGERRLRVGYIQETPVWKTSYRLLLSEREKPFLQGWAIVENTGDHDWNAIDLSLVSGRPVSFRMDLDQPLYASRPFVMPELFAGLRPRRHGQDLLTPDIAVAPRNAGGRGGASGGVGGGFGSGMGGMGGGGGYFGGGGHFGGGGSTALPRNPASGEPANTDPNRYTGLAATAPSAAVADDTAELFRYAISAPVTLEQQKSAMLPIVNEAVGGAKIFIFNPVVDRHHPLAGFRLKNATQLHLMQGPITVFDNGEYAGDAQIADIAPGAERLVSYALDLDTEVSVSSRAPIQRLIGIRVADGVVKSDERAERATLYHLKNSGDQEKTLLIEQPIDNQWPLTKPAKPTEQTHNLYRFAVSVPAGGVVDFAVEEVRQIAKAAAFFDLTDDYIAFQLTGKIASEPFKAALRKLQQLRAAASAAEERTTFVMIQLKEISDEQGRIRANMAALDKSAKLYERYAQMLDAQEDTIKQLRDKLPDLRGAEAAAAQALHDFAVNLSVE